MKPFQRAEVATLLRRLADPPAWIVAVFGPRQTGKTTAVRQALRQIERPSRYVAVDEPDAPTLRPPPDGYPHSTVPVSGARDEQWLVRHWVDARREAERSPRGCVLVLDEIQKIPRWSDTVKGLWDADRAAARPLHVVILGSSPLFMQSGLRESLAGRFEPIRFTHWSFPEMADAFGLDLPAYLYFGGYPGAASLRRDEARWREYVSRALVEPAVERDLLSMTRVDKPALLKRLFEQGAAASGQVLSYTRMLGELRDAGNTTTLARYLGLLENVGLLAGLPKYASRPHRRGSSPKFNVLNTALMTAGSGYAFDEARADRTFWGRVVESAVGAHLFNTAASDVRLHYWRESPHEVDFVLRRGPRLVAVEVKSGPRRGPLRGLETFAERFRPRRSLLVGEGGTPLHEFLAAPAGAWFEEAS